MNKPIITLKDVSDDGKHVNREKLAEMIPNFNELNQTMQERVVRPLESGARVYVTTARVMDERMQMKDELAGMVVDWGAGTNGAYILLNDRPGKNDYSVVFHGQGFNIARKGMEPLSNQHFYYTKEGVMNQQPLTPATRAIVQNILSNNGQGPELDFSAYHRTSPLADNGTFLRVGAEGGSTLIFSKITRGVDINVHGSQEKHPTRIVGDIENFEGIEVTMPEQYEGRDIRLKNMARKDPKKDPKRDGNVSLWFDLGRKDGKTGEITIPSMQPETVIEVNVVGGKEYEKVIMLNQKGEPTGTPEEIQAALKEAAQDAKKPSIQPQRERE